MNTVFVLLEQALAWAKHLQLKDHKITNYNLASDSYLPFPYIVSIFEPKPVCTGDTEVVDKEANITSTKVDKRAVQDVQHQCPLV